jgi:NADPH2:quinone reductase
LRAAVITGEGGPEVLSIQEVPTPEPGPREIRVRVEASAINRADLLQCRGRYPAPPGWPAHIPGLELAGFVDACGADVTRWRVGDAVMAVVGGGACADAITLLEDEAVPIPGGMAPTDAAAIPEAFFTAYDAAVLQGGLEGGGWLAINAVGSGVGTAAVQIARCLGARSVGSSRTQFKLDRATTMGLDVPVLGSSDALAAAARQATDKHGVQVVVDLLGGEGLEALTGALTGQGRLILVGLLAGIRSQLNLGRVLTRRLTVTGTVLRSRPTAEKVALARAFESKILPHFEGSTPSLYPVIDRAMPLAHIADAHRLLASNQTFGKIVLDHTL